MSENETGGAAEAKPGLRSPLIGPQPIMPEITTMDRLRIRVARSLSYLSPRAGRAQAAFGGRSWIRTPKRSFGYGPRAKRAGSG
jgi:hypothetical protein